MMTILGNKEKFESEKNDDSLQPNNSALKATIDLMERTTTDNCGGGLCSDSHHLHSFRSVSFLLLPFYTCAGCGEKLQSYVLGGSSSAAAAVQCIGCGVYAHRKCAFSRHIEWKTKCSSMNREECTNVGGVCENSNDPPLEHIDDAETEKDTKPCQTISEQISEGSFDTSEGDLCIQLTITDDTCSHIASRNNATESIFRRISTRTKKLLARKDLPVVRASASVDNFFRSTRVPNNIQQTRANFPFLSSASLLPSRCNNNNKENGLLTIRKCNTWNGVIEASSPTDKEDQHNNTKVEVSNDKNEEISHGDDDENDNTNTSTNYIDHETTAPLHFASNDIQVVSQAPQENISGNLNRWIRKESSSKESNKTESSEDECKSDLEKNDPLSPVDPTSANIKEEQNDSRTHSPLELSETKQESTMDQKRLGLATVAGSIVGGVVGVGLAGPVGGVIGLKCGQTAGILGFTNDIERETTAPLHFASHGFRVVSQVLQENIIANFNRLIPKESSSKDIDKTESSEDECKTDLEKSDPSSPVDPTSANNEKPPNTKVEDEQDDSQAHSLLESSEPKQESTMDKKRLGLATVAGSIVGGVVGVGLAGPVGGMIGVKCGQTAGMLGLLLEGSFTASALASGITAGIAAGQHFQERHDTRVLALGEGTKQRVLLMVRPTIQPPEPVWDEIYQQARRSYSGSNSGLVNRLIPNESQAAKRERYEREIDIVETGEDELTIGDKVMLLVSRILSNKDSLPGHVYRKLIEAFRRRSREVNLQELHRNNQELQINDAESVESCGNNDLSTSITENEEQIEDEQLSRMHQRRRDTHAVIKYITTSLLLTRPGFGHSSSFTEKTATAVESLVFGEIYDLVTEEIELEYQNQDDLLLEKIANFERRQDQGEDSLKTPGNPCFGYKSYISEAALEALHCLPRAHSAVDKLRYCVVFLEQISEKFSNTATTSVMGADSLLKMVCQHILLAKVIGINSQIAFLEEFARDEQLLRGREGYALVTLQASLHFLNSSTDFESDIFGEDLD
uniref:VPS9 domain-containing protein n=1 Tax=Pseudo-nitzschia australis TaxID=44445 RepID=A0A7S4EG19_9STRA